MIRLECGNEDSCGPGATHEFPEVDGRARLRPGDYQILGREIRTFRAEEPIVGRVTAHVEHAHMVLVRLRDHNITVYADIEDDILS